MSPTDTKKEADIAKSQGIDMIAIGFGVNVFPYVFHIGAVERVCSVTYFISIFEELVIEQYYLLYFMKIPAIWLVKWQVTILIIIPHVNSQWPGDDFECHTQCLTAVMGYSV